MKLSDEKVSELVTQLDSNIRDTVVKFVDDQKPPLDADDGSFISYMAMTQALGAMHKTIRDLLKIKEEVLQNTFLVAFEYGKQSTDRN